MTNNSFFPQYFFDCKQVSSLPPVMIYLNGEQFPLTHEDYVVEAEVIIKVLPSSKIRGRQALFSCLAVVDKSACGSLIEKANNTSPNVPGPKTFHVTKFIADSLERFFIHSCRKMGSKSA